MDNDELLVAIKNMFEKKTDEIKQYVDEKINGQSVLIESLRSDIKAVAEGHDILNRKIDEKTNEIKNEVKEIKDEMTVMKADIKSLKSDMSVVKDYIIGVDAKLNEHEVILKRVK